MTEETSVGPQGVPTKHATGMAIDSATGNATGNVSDSATNTATDSANMPTEAADDTLDARTRFAIISDKRRQQHKSLKPGSVIKARFRLEREIGRGGMGVVYAARDLVQEAVGEKASLLAVKLLSEDFRQHPESLRMLQQECKKAQSLAHPNIGTVYDFDRDDNNVYMTMELLSGCSLQTYLKDNSHHQIPFEKVASILTEIVAGLDYAHRHNIIHSDLKPANIFLTPKGAKILDFGIARAVMDSETGRTEASFQRRSDSDNSSVSSDATNDKKIALTPSYASLEMFLGERPDVRDDIYGLACIAYKLLTGNHPFGKRSAKAAHAQQLVPQRAARLKEWQWKALKKGLALERKDRVGSAPEFLESLLSKRSARQTWLPYLVASIVVIIGIYFFVVPTAAVKSGLFNSPPPAAKLTATQQQNVDDILEIAEVHMMVGRLVSPPGGNALDEYKKVLKLNAYNQRAIAGLIALLKSIEKQVKTSIQSGEYKQARELIDVGLGVHAEHPGLLALQSTLRQRGNATQP